MVLLPQSPNEHVDVALSQINPLVEVHIDVPHWQSALLNVVPSIRLQYGIVLQVLVDVSQ